MSPTPASVIPAHPHTNLLAEVCPFNLVQLHDAEARYHAALAKDSQKKVEFGMAKNCFVCLESK